MENPKILLPFLRYHQTKVILSSNNVTGKVNSTSIGVISNLSCLNNSSFSTGDVDNDKYDGGSCAGYAQDIHRGPWWHDICYRLDSYIMVYIGCL